MKITIIGTGYVGLVSGAVFADWGNSVMCLDIDAEKIKKIQEGIMPIYEEGLEELVAKVQASGNFVATTDYQKAIEHGDLIFICVGTPSNQSGAADLKYVFEASVGIAKYMQENSHKIVVTKSTVPVGTNERIRQVIKDNLNGKKAVIDIASNPEFLREGYSIFDANNTDRVVIGSDSQEALNTLEQLYGHLKTEIVKTTIQSAELIKYASNAFLATKISFINEISQICERVGADVTEVSRGMGLDKRIGGRFLTAGIGYGGSCFPKDVEALYRTSSEYMYDFRLLRGVMDANERQKHYFMDKVWNKYGHNLSKYTFGILGVAFKENTDDVRKSVALDIVKMLRGAGASLKIFDYAAMENAKKDLGDSNIKYADKDTDVFYESDAVFILTEWKEFTKLNYESLGTKMKAKVIFDGRNILSSSNLSKFGYEYNGIGLKRSS